MKDLDLFPAYLFTQLYKEVWGSEITIVLGDLVFQDQVISEGVPRQIRNQTVILVKVASKMSEDDVRIEIPLQVLEKLLDLASQIRKETISEFLDGQRVGFRFLQEPISAFPCFS